MNNFMTFSAYGNNDHWCIVIGMMILLSLLVFASRTVKIVWLGQSSISNGVMHNMLSFYFLWIFKLIIFFVLFVILFLFFGTFIRYSALYAMTVMAVFASSVFMKFRNWFGLLAFRASLGYDAFSHIFVPFNDCGQSHSRATVPCVACLILSETIK